MKRSSAVGLTVLACVFVIAGIFGFRKLRELETELISLRDQLNTPRPAPVSLTIKPEETRHSVLSLEKTDEVDKLRQQLQRLLAERDELALNPRANPAMRAREQWNGLPVFLALELDKKYGQPKVNSQGQRVPTYPAKHRADKINGAVDLSFIVGIDGKVHDIKVLKSSDPAFEAYAVEAVKGWSFIPGSRKGEPANARITLPIKFNIVSESPPNPRWF